ncbi:MAG: chromosome segregation protein SMC [Galactobacter sp.]
MYLKTLTVRGFKSFASATTFEFEPGVTAVVGPNGSGKSNVVDALAWVMGEQGAKTLRGAKMEDVIFAGTTSRPALGRAQVTLTIDNTDGALPIEYTEVTISRTLFRSGGSEYAINGSPCRLLDIQELLSDSGLGREMHVIVGQGQLDRILRATPEERRGFIEEASGILKHRRRKEKTLRKLDAMQANLARLEDLTGEIAKQLKPLGRQAATARRAQTVQATVHDAKARLLADDLTTLLNESEQATAELTELDALRVHAQTAVHQANQKLTDLEKRAADSAPITGSARENWYALSRLQERYRALIGLAEERRRLLGAHAETPTQGEDPEALDARAEAATQEAEQAKVEVAAAQEKLTQSTNRRAEAESAQKQEDTRLTAVLRAVADRREGLARLAGEVGKARQRLESAEGERTRSRDAGEAARERAATTESELIAARAAADSAAERAKVPVSAVAGLRDELTAARAAVREARDAVGPLAEIRAGLEARVETLGEAQPADIGTGELLTGKENRILGVLSDRLSVEPGLEAAVAAGLAGAEAAVLAVDRELALELARAAAEGTDGSVWLLSRPDAGLPDATTLPPGARPLAELIGCDDEDRPLIDALLSGVVLAADDATAQLIAAEGKLIAVTDQGHRWDATGLRIGSSNAAALTRRSRFEAAQQQLVAARQQETAARAEVQAREPAVTELSTQLKDAEVAAGQATDASRKAAAEVSRLGSLAARAQDEAQRADAALERVASTVIEATSALQDLNHRLESAQAVREEEEPSTAERDRLAKVAEATRTDEVQARLDLRAAEESARRLEDRVSAIRRAARRERQARIEAERRARRRAHQAARAERVARLATFAEERLQVVTDAAEQAVRRAESTQRRLGAEVDTARAALGRVKDEVTRLAEAGHVSEVARAQRETKLENLKERVLEEVAITPDYLVQHFGPHMPVPAEPDPNDRWAALRVEVDEDGNPVEGVAYDRAAQEKRLKRAERDLTALGKINPLALEEYAALEERHTYLVQQLDDLKRSRADLLDLVRQVDAHVREVFSSAYEDTAVEFKRIFARLFPGGEGELVLTEPGDMLATGIDVHARPAGKKVKRLSLLSGGERSLTAIAMLVAIFTARPSPFYVMDEVEAALDERNLMRLLGVFADLREKSQLIIITHQKHTMDIADALYGVSMRGDGVTQVISQRIEHTDA